MEGVERYVFIRKNLPHNTIIKKFDLNFHQLHKCVRVCPTISFFPRFIEFRFCFLDQYSWNTYITFELTSKRTEATEIFPQISDTNRQEMEKNDFEEIGRCPNAQDPQNWRKIYYR